MRTVPQGSWDYPVTLAPNGNNTVSVDFPDFPEAHTLGDDEADAMAHAVDALMTAVDRRIRQRVPFPAPTRRATGPYVRLPFLVALLDNEAFNA